MRNEEKLAALVNQWLPSRGLVIGILTVGLVAAILLTGYEIGERSRAEQRAHAAEQRVEQLEAEVALLTPGGGRNALRIDTLRSPVFEAPASSK